MIARLVFAATLLASVSIATPSGAVASAELYHTVPYAFGRFEARIRFPAGDGVVGSFFLWKEGSEVAGTFWNELDFEKVQADCRVQSNALYGNPVINTSQFDPIAGDLCGSYHDYRIDWTPDYIAWAVDGQEIRRETGEIATAFAQNAAGGMTFHFNVWPGNQEFGGNFDPAILPVHQYVSWVQYSSYQGGDFQLEWREEFDGTSLPSGWLTGDWTSPKGLSTHSAANANFVGGISILSLTDDNATGFTGTPPIDDAAGTDGSVTNGTGDSGTTGVGGATTGGTTDSGATNDTGTNVGGAATADSASTPATASTNTSGSATTQSTTGAGGAASGGTVAGATSDGTTGPGGSLGATTSAAGDAASGDNAGSTDGGEAGPEEESGCACRLAVASAGSGRHAGLFVLLAVAASLIVVRRRRAVVRRARSVAP